MMIVIFYFVYEDLLNGNIVLDTLSSIIEHVSGVSYFLLYVYIYEIG